MSNSRDELDTSSRKKWRSAVRAAFVFLSDAEIEMIRREFESEAPAVVCLAIKSVIGPESERLGLAIRRSLPNGLTEQEEPATALMAYMAAHAQRDGLPIKEAQGALKALGAPQPALDDLGKSAEKGTITWDAMNRWMRENWRGIAEGALLLTPPGRAYRALRWFGLGSVAADIVATPMLPGAK